MNTVDTILNASIDFAGLFPPALLSIEESVAAFESYANHPRRNWLSGRFVASTAHLPKMQLFLERRPRTQNAPPLSIAAVLPTPETSQNPLAMLATAREATLAAEALRTMRIETIEAAIPPGIEPEEYLAALRERFPTLPIFVEIPFGDMGKSALELLARAGRNGPFHAKFRTGGLRPAQVPTAKALAQRLIQAAELGISWKATAGLHQPFYHFDVNVGANLFGFLNLFVAAALALRKRGSVDEVARLLALTETFQVDERGLRAGPWEFSIAELENMRRSFALGFGSCSFMEPVEEMAARFGGNR